MYRQHIESFRSIRRFLASLFLWSVAMNYPWEMIQMPLYNAMPFSDPMSWIICFQASLGDGVIIMTIWGIGFLVFRDRLWFTRRNAWSLAILLISGAVIATLIEIHALRTGRWSYSSLMPLVPPANVGLSPFIQLLILPYLSMRLAVRIPLIRSPRH